MLRSSTLLASGAVKPAGSVCTGGLTPRRSPFRYGFLRQRGQKAFEQVGEVLGLGGGGGQDLLVTGRRRDQAGGPVGDAGQGSAFQPSALAASTSRPVDMPTASAPHARRARISAGVS